MNLLTVKSRRKNAKQKLIVFLILAGLLVIVGILAPLLTPNDPNATSAADMNQAPSEKFPLAQTATAAASSRA